MRIIRNIFIGVMLLALAIPSTAVQAQITAPDISDPGTRISDGSLFESGISNGGYETGTPIGTGVGVSYDNTLTNDQKAAQNANQDVPKTSCSFNLLTFNLVECAFSKIGYLIMRIMSVFLYIAGMILDGSLFFTTHMTELVDKLGIVNIGWTIFRDLSNILFIFVLLWISIATILGLAHGETKKMLARVVLVALLINFSLFFTKALIDASNIVTLHFYSAITNGGQGNLSSAFMEGLNIQTVYSGTKGLGALGSTVLNVAEVVSITPAKILFSSIFGSILMLVAAFVFFAAAIMFLLRAVVLMFLMLLSPIAFMGHILPATEHYAKQWWEKLWKNLIFAPAFMALAYVVVATIQSHGFRDVMTVMTVSGSTGIIAGFAQLVNFIILIMMMGGCLLVASHFGAAGSETMLSWGKGMASWGAIRIGFLAGAGTGFLGKHTIGRAARAIDQKLKASTLWNRPILDTIRKNTLENLAEHAKFGGGESFEEYHHRGMKLEERKDALTAADKVVVLGAEYDKKVEASRLIRERAKKSEGAVEAAEEELRKANESGDATKIATSDQKLQAAKEALRFDQSAKAKAELEQKEMQEKVEQQIMRISPEVFAKLPEQKYEENNGILMRFATNAQVRKLMANTDDWSQAQKDKWLHLKDKAYYDKTWGFEHGDESWAEYEKTGKLTGKEKKGAGGMLEYKLKLRDWEEGQATAWGTRKNELDKLEKQYRAGGAMTDEEIEEKMTGLNQDFERNYEVEHPKPKEPNFGTMYPELCRKLRAADKDDAELILSSRDMEHPERPNLAARLGTISAFKMSTLGDLRKSKTLSPQTVENMRYTKAYDIVAILDLLDGIDPTDSEDKKNQKREKMRDYDAYFKNLEELEQKHGKAYVEGLQVKLQLTFQGKTPDELVAMPSGIRKRMSFVRAINHTIAGEFSVRDTEDLNLNIRAALRDEVSGRTTLAQRSFLKAWRSNKTKWTDYYGDEPVIGENNRILMVKDSTGAKFPLNRWISSGDWANDRNPDRDKPAPVGKLELVKE